MSTPSNNRPSPRHRCARHYRAHRRGIPANARTANAKGRAGGARRLAAGRADARGPNSSKPALELVDALLKQGRRDDAISSRPNLVEREPQHALALWHLGYALQLAGRHADAIPFYERAHAIDADRAHAAQQSGRGVSKLSGHTRGQALALLEEAVAANVADIEAWTNLTRMYPRHHELEHALAAGKRAVQIDAVECAGAVQLQPRAERSAALAGSHRQPRKPPPNSRRKRRAFRSICRLLDLMQGNYARGWANFESRWDGSGELRGTHPAFASAALERRIAARQDIVVVGRARFRRRVAVLPLRANACQTGSRAGRHARMGRPSRRCIRCWRAWRRRTSSACRTTDRLPAFDFHFPLLSLPLHFGMDERHDSGQARVSFRRYRARGRMARASPRSDKRLRVGLVWSGSQDHQRNQFRSVGIDRYATRV